METFERDAPLFDRRFHVLVQYPDRDEKLLPLTIRLLNGVRVRHWRCPSCRGIAMLFLTRHLWFLVANSRTARATRRSACCAWR